MPSAQGSGSLVFGKASLGPFAINWWHPHTGSPVGGSFQTPAAAVHNNKSVYTVIEYTYRGTPCLEIKMKVFMKRPSLLYLPCILIIFLFYCMFKKKKNPAGNLQFANSVRLGHANLQTRLSPAPRPLGGLSFRFAGLGNGRNYQSRPVWTKAFRG